MKLFGLQIGRVEREVKMATSVVNAGGNGGWFGVIREAWSGAFQQAITVDSPRQIMAFSAVFSCVTMIASDISKLCIDLMQEDDDGISSPAGAKSPFWAVIKKPNRYQTRIKFIEQWIVSKMLHGNAYILKERDARGIVTAMYVLDGQRVKTLVTDSGDIYYGIEVDPISGVDQSITVPASEIIHDMMVSLWHPLVGVSPIYACGASASMGNRIQANSSQFFQNMSRPSGMLSGPGVISDEVGGRLKRTFEEGFSLGNLGRLFVAGDGLKYEPMTIPAQDAQLIEQLKWTVEDVARCFKMPLFKIGGPVPAGSSIDSLNQIYYSDCLQALIESLELLLDEGLSLPVGYHTELDLDGLLRMDTAARYDSTGKAVGAGWMSPNEARKKDNRKPVPGGETPYLQQQYWGLEQLSKRTAAPDGVSITPAPSAPVSSQSNADNAAANDEQLNASLAEMSAVYLRSLNIDYEIA